MTRKRGAQPNNRNAFKHGFYSKHFNTVEKNALDSILSSDLTPEIDLLRVNIDRMMQQYTASLPELDFEKRLEVLRVTAQAAGSIASLERLRASLGPRIREAREIEEKILNAFETDSDKAKDIPG